MNQGIDAVLERCTKARGLAESMWAKKSGSSDKSQMPIKKTMTTAHRPPMAQILGPKPISRLSEEEGTAILETQDAIAQGFNTVLGRRDKPQTLDDSIWAPKGAKSDAPSNRQQKGTSDSYKTGVYEAAQAIHNKIQRGPGNVCIVLSCTRLFPYYPCFCLTILSCLPYYPMTFIFQSCHVKMTHAC